MKNIKNKRKIKDEIPEFKTEDEEREFWAIHSALDYPERFKPVKLYIPNLKKTKVTVDSKKKAK